MADKPSHVAPWAFLSRYAHVLICLAENPEIRMREIASRLDVTERSVQKMIRRLEQDRVIRRHRVGRSNRYEIDLGSTLDHQFESRIKLGDLLGLLLELRRVDGTPDG